VARPAHGIDGSIAIRKCQCCAGSSGRIDGRNREVAETYHISTKTIDTYRARLLRKPNLRNNAELTRFAIQNRVVEV